MSGGPFGGPAIWKGDLGEFGRVIYGSPAAIQLGVVGVVEAINFRGSSLAV